MEEDATIRAAARETGAERKRRAVAAVQSTGGTRIGFNAPGDILAIIDRVKHLGRYSSRDAALCAIIKAYAHHKDGLKEI